MRTRLPLCAAAAAAVLLVGPAAADSDSVEDAPVVKALRFVGLSFASAGELREAILTSAPSWKFWRPDPPFDEDTLREDLDRIVAFYRERGYYEAQAEYELEWRDDRSALRVRIRVSEGEPVLLADWAIEAPGVDWLDAGERERLLDGLPLVEGSPFGAMHYRTAKEELLKRLANRGHPAARLDGGAEVDLASHSARLHWTLDPGPEVRFGAVRFAGLEGVAEELVRRELAFQQGEAFSLAALDTSQKRIYGLGLFRSVTLQDERPAAGASGRPDREIWPIVVRVEERPPRTVRISVGYGTEDQFRTQLSWLHRNFFGGARSLELIAKYSSLLAGAEAGFVQPRFLDPKLRLESDLAFLRETVPAFDAYRVSGGLRLSRPLVEKWRGRVGYRFEWSDVTDLKAADLVGDDEARTSTLSFGLSRSTIADPLEPRGGTWLDFSVAPTLEAIGSESSFLELSAEGRAYVPLFATVLAARLRARTIQPLAGSRRDDVPTVSRFYAGGSGSVRGFEFQHLPPLDDSEDPLGGLTLVEGSLELRFPIWRLLRGVAFLDAGQLAPGPFGFDVDDLYYSIGPGIRVTTPIGSLGLDYGYLLRRPSGLDRGRIHFSVGATF